MGAGVDARWVSVAAVACRAERSRCKSRRSTEPVQQRFELRLLLWRQQSRDLVEQFCFIP